MKILLAHNFYGSSALSGENSVYLAEKELLQGKDHKVVEFTRHSDEIRNQGLFGTLKGALSTPWNPFSRKAIMTAIRREEPDVMHVHNTFPLLSPSIFHTPANSKTAVVYTLHNYRTVCAAAILNRDDAICTECIDEQSVLSGVKYGCYRQSRLATLPLSFSIALHKILGTWKDNIDAFIVLTEFQKKMMVKAGFPEEKIYIKPHFYPDPPEPVPWEHREEKVVYIGRLSAEKGVNSLMKAWQKWGEGASRLEVIGNGPLRPELKKMVHGLRNKIVFTGQLSFQETQARLTKSRMLVLPSICFEGFPMVIREAFSLGVPVAASDIGSIPFILNDQKDGVLFAPGDSSDLLQKVRGLWADQKQLVGMADEARAEFDNKYTAGRNYMMLMDIYEQAVANRLKRMQ